MSVVAYTSGKSAAVLIVTIQSKALLGISFLQSYYEYKIFV